MTVDHLETRLRGGAGSHQYVEGVRNIACTEPADVVGIDSIGQTELLAHSHLRGSLTGNLLCQGGYSQQR